MIEQVSGQILQKSPTFCVVNCHGIGIGLFISINTYQKLADEGNSATMLTYLHVREDALQLYGFGDEEERRMFRQLIGVSGIGPRLALTILSGLTVRDLVQAIAVGDYQLLTKTPGVGKKTAQRVILELKEKVEIESEMEKMADFSGYSTPVRNTIDEAILAMTTLGYRQFDARRAVEKVLRKSPEGLPLEDLIKLALKEV